MTDSAEQLPVPIQEAQASLGQQRRFVGQMMAGVAVGMLGILGGAALGAPDPVVLGTTGAMVVWVLGNVGWMQRYAADWQRAAAVVKEWDRRKLAHTLDGTQPEPPALAEPDDPRWQNLQTLLGRIRELAGDDTHLVQVTRDVEGKLRGLLEDRTTLLAAIEADRALGGDSDGARARTRRLQQALDARSATADRLIEAIRDLHVELAVRDASTDPLVDRLEALLSQVEAEAEVASVGTEDERAEKARLARVQHAARQRE